MVREYFEQKARADVRLTDAIPELLRVIDGLEPLRNNRLQTNKYLEQFLISKLVDGRLSVQDDYVCWLTEYFYEQYKVKSGRTTSYAYALELLIHYFNRGVKRGDIMNNIAMEQGQYLDSILFGVSNTDVLDAIKQESLVIDRSNGVSGPVRTLLPFQNYLVGCRDDEHKQAVMIKLHSLLDNAKGKQVSLVIRALHSLSLITIKGNKLYELLESEFGDIGAISNINNFLNPASNSYLTESDIKITVDVLKSL
jgi:hypothetical protein